MNNSLSSATVQLKGCMVTGVRRSENRDEKSGKLEGVRFYASLQWFGGQANVELEPELDNIPQGQLLDIEIDADITELISKFKGEERWRTCASFRHIKSFKPASLSVPASPGASSGKEVPAFPIGGKGAK